MTAELANAARLTLRSLDDDPLETPFARVELGRVERNLATAIRYCRAHGLAWRPHVKTHKSPFLAAAQLRAGAAGLTVATPREAEVMATVCDDILLAHPPVGSKARRLMALPPRVRLTVALDSERALAELAGAANEAGREVGVLVEIDVGMGRVGVPDPEQVVELARRISGEPRLRWRGILFYPGHIRVPAADQETPLAEVAARVGATLEGLADAGLYPEVVSGGSTPTFFQSHRIPGLTEVRPGTSIFHDRDSVALGVATLDEVAYTVEATVVSTALPGQAVVDAGSKALAREEFRARADEGGYGVVMGRPEVRVRSVSEEHGILGLEATEWRPRVGDRVRIIPNHVCVSVNLQDRLVAELPDDGGDGRGGKEGGLRELPLPGRGRSPWSPGVG